jgi:hypothetical protein
MDAETSTAAGKSPAAVVLEIVSFREAETNHTLNVSV